MDIRSLIRVAYNALLRNKSRSILTTLGIIIGVASVILLMSIGTGLQLYIEKQFETIGSNTVYIMPFKATDSEGNLEGFQGPPSTSFRAFTRQDVRLIQRIGYPLKSVIPIIEKLVEVSYKGKTGNKFSVISASNYGDVRTLDIVKGRFFTQSEDLKGKRVVVLGFDAAEDLFGTFDPLGRKIIIDATAFTVIGVADKLGGLGIGPNIDDVVYLPLESGQKLFNIDTFDFIGASVVSAEKMSEAVEKVEEAMLKRRKSDEFSVLDQAQILESIGSILSALTAGVGGIAAISLLVGGIGIMNIMLVSVTERTREIGLRKAVGATPRVILIQFLIESVVLSFVGGIIGILIGLGGSMLINQFFPASVSFWSVALSFSVSAVVGIVFGILPARRASLLSPINALRYE